MHRAYCVKCGQTILLDVIAVHRMCFAQGDAAEQHLAHKAQIVDVLKRERVMKLPNAA